MNVDELKQKAMDVIRAGESCTVEEFFGALSAFKRNVTTATILALIAERDELLAALDAIIALPSHPMRKKAVEIAIAAKAKVEG